MKKLFAGMALLSGLLACADGHLTEEAGGAGEGVDAPVLGQQATGGPKITNLGAECSADAGQCKGTDTRCLTTLPAPLSFTIKGGFCTAGCTIDAQCGATGACPLAPLVTMARRFMPDAGADLDQLSVCLTKCTANTECRGGMVCQALPSIPLGPKPTGQKYCMPPLPDAGMPSVGGIGN